MAIRAPRWKTGQMKPRVFIGSSVEGLSVAYALQENLEHDVEATVWPQGAFSPSDFVLSALLDALENYDFGIFVFTPDDVVHMRGQDHPAVRDNVLFELGLFTGGLGVRRTAIVLPNGQEQPRLPTDLLGLTRLFTVGGEMSSCH
jgi:predicted nucleotide-binding protein